MSSSRYQSRPAAPLAVRRSKRPAALSACSSTRRRRRRVADADADAAITRDASSWASLPGDLLDLIAWRVLAVDLVDYVRFRAVCAHWRSSIASPRGRGIVDRRFHPRRWMMFPEGHGFYPGHGKLRGFVRFFNLSTGAFVRVHLPLFRDHCALDSIDGLLLLQRDHDTVIRLLHPFTGDIIDFPPLETLHRHFPSSLMPSQRVWCCIRRIRAASMNVSADEVVSLMFLGTSFSKIAFATSREKQWRISSWVAPTGFSPLSFQGKIYMVCDNNSFTNLDVLEISPPQLEDGVEPWMPPPRFVARCPGPSRSTNSYLSYLVECGTEILVVFVGHRWKKISVYRLADLMVGRVVPMTSIGGNALFIEGRKLYVSSKAFPTIVGDTIFFLNGHENYLAQYHLSSGAFSPATDKPTSEYAKTSPCSIINHINTCCYRHQWNKGHMAFWWQQNMWRVKGKWRIGA